jgi:hypothetical protein
MWEIIVRETVTTRKTKGKDWKVVGQRIEMSDHGDKVVDKYDYTPEVETVQTETITRYEQRTETLDLKAVINAVNNAQ